MAKASKHGPGGDRRRLTVGRLVGYVRTRLADGRPPTVRELASEFHVDEEIMRLIVVALEHEDVLVIDAADNSSLE